MQRLRREGLRSGSLRQDHFFECEIRDGFPQPGIFLLHLFHSLHLVDLEPAELTPPAVIGHLRHTDGANNVWNLLTLRNQHIRLAKLRHYLFQLVGLLRHIGPPRDQSPTSSRITSLWADQSSNSRQSCVPSVKPSSYFLPADIAPMITGMYCFSSSSGACG